MISGSNSKNCLLFSLFLALALVISSILETAVPQKEGGSTKKVHRFWALSQRGAPGASCALLLVNDARLGRALRRAQVTRDGFLVRREYDDFIEHAIATGVELQRLGHVPILLLDGAVVRDHVHGELALFRVNFLQLQAHGAHRSGMLAAEES